MLLAGVAACREEPANAAVPAKQVQLAPVGTYETRINTPMRLRSVVVSVEANGSPTRVRCGTCHSLRKPKPLPHSMSDLREFHLGLEFQHGSLSCRACHAEGQPPQLNLADGTTLPMQDALRLCAQCHGTQFTNYRHGAHGGMNGYWDTRRGERLKNHCVDCHDPHTPAIEPVLPKPPPRDRFFESGGSH